MLGTSLLADHETGARAGIGIGKRRDQCLEPHATGVPTANRALQPARSHPLTHSLSPRKKSSWDRVPRPRFQNASDILISSAASDPPTGQGSLPPRPAPPPLVRLRWVSKLRAHRHGINEKKSPQKKTLAPGARPVANRASEE